jgi:hypothetical protein
MTAESIRIAQFRSTPTLINGDAAEDAGFSVTTDGLRSLLSLDGDWVFQFGDEIPQVIRVPGPWESQRHDLRERAGTAVYEHRFTVPESFNGRRIVLKFGAVDYYAEVWVNGMAIGTHEGGYLPFSFPIEHALNGYGPDVVHILLVRVTDATVEQDATLPNGEILHFAEIPHGKQSWYSSVGGIWQSVLIEAMSHQHVGRVTLLPDIDAGSVHARISIEGQAQQAVARWHARISIESPEGAEPVESVRISVPPCQGVAGSSVEITHEIHVPNPALWSPDSPALYTALVTLECEGEVIDAVSRRFGMRKIEAKEGRIWLNNRQLFVIGALDQAFYPRSTYTLPSSEFLRDQFLKAKEMGLNLMRCHIKVPSSTYLDLCDELGLLVWYEIPNGALLSEPFRVRARETLRQMWQRDANHPCIVIVSLMNESWGIDLNDVEQRRWLASTYRWAKELAPSWLVVDNSACIPNFHVVSDLADYHVYFNIPDQAEDFAEWMQAFAERQAGAFTGYGDAETRQNEPLLISEFGNWGLPRVENIYAAEGGEPYWFQTGEGPARPNKVLKRFQEQKLERAFADYNALADASQEQEWLSLKWEIEEMRRHPEVAGYVVTEFTDVNWECNGLLDFGRNRKVFHDRLRDLQRQDILIPRLSPRTAFWEGEPAALTITFSSFSGRRVAGGKLRWWLEGCNEMQGEEPVRLGGMMEKEPPCGSYVIGQIWLTAPAVPVAMKSVVHVELDDANGELVARTEQNIVFAPISMKAIGKGRKVWLHDPLGSAIGLSSLLTGIGCRVAAQPEPDAIGLVTRWDPVVSNFLHDGGKAILVATHAKSITIASGLGVRLLERNTNGWWGDWCTSRIWFASEFFPSLPDTVRFDFEYQPIVPERVVTGPPAKNVAAGLFVGWLHNPGALVARLPMGKGDLVVTTFQILPNIGIDPIATLLLNDLFAMPAASREE